MLKKIASKLTYANVVATLALFIALGGTTIAATKLHGSQIKPGTVTGKQIRANSVPGGDLRKNTVTGRQVKESTLARVPRARQAELAEQASRAAQANVAAKATQADRAARADQAELAANAERLDGQPASAYLDRCPPGHRAYAGACFEETARPSATWTAAAKICGDAGGRLPGLDELEGFRQLPGITLSGSEHTSAYLDFNGLTEGGEFTVGLYDNGNRANGYSYGASYANFRCVKPLTNR